MSQGVVFRKLHIGCKKMNIYFSYTEASESHCVSYFSLCCFVFVPNFKLHLSFIWRREINWYGKELHLCHTFIFRQWKIQYNAFRYHSCQGACILILVEFAFYFMTSSCFGSWFGKWLLFKTHIRQMSTILLSQQFNMCS